MLRRFLFPLFVLLAIVAFPGGRSAQGGGGSSLYLPFVSYSPLAPPVLQWAYAGCKSTSCGAAWYSSPAVLDVNGDGNKDVLATNNNMLKAVDGPTGVVLWSYTAPGERSSPPVAVGDIDKDGTPEIVIGQWGGWISVLTPKGTLKWQKQISLSEDTGNPTAELRDVALADLDGNNGAMEVIIGRGEKGGQFGKNTWVLDSSGNMLPGWPELSMAKGYSAGMYNANIAVGDLDGDGKQELVVPSDMHYINIYKPDGSPILANQAVFPGLYWGQVGVWENPLTERNSKLRDCSDPNLTRDGHYRTNFAYSPAVITDVENDGVREIVVTGNTIDCTKPYPPSQYTGVYIFNADRTRYSKPGADWNYVPLDTGKPLSEEDSSVIRSIRPSPAVADLDGDGKKEILYPSYDGRMHAFWLDKTEHGAWPYAVTKPGEGVIQFASEPVIADLDNDGKAEVIFTSWTQVGSNRWGKLHILSWDGKPIYEVDLPKPLNKSINWSGSLATPTLANIDGDPDLEVVLDTYGAGVVAYDLPGTEHARILWGTGRGNFARTGSQ